MGIEDAYDLRGSCGFSFGNGCSGGTSDTNLFGAKKVRTPCRRGLTGTPVNTLRGMTYGHPPNFQPQGGTLDLFGKQPSLGPAIQVRTPEIP
jgi:hypothetical protein